MGVDLRVGRNEYYTRYRVYRPDVNINDSLSIDKNFVGILHAKDITSYQHQTENVANRFMVQTTRATLETTDSIELGANYLLYAIDEELWYLVESVAPNSHNESQEFSRRPINTTQIVIRRGN